jgi:ATP-binding cassette subfamily B protein RaxB
LKCLFAKRQQRMTAETLTAKSHEQSCLIENIRGIQPIKIFSKEGDRISLWVNRYVDFLKSSYKTNFIKALTDNIKECLTGMEFIFIIFIAGLSIIHHQLSLGVVYSFLFYRQQFAESLSLFVDKLYDFKMLSIYQERLDDILHHPVDVNRQAIEASPSDFSLHAANLSYSYRQAGPMLFSNLTLTIHAGECVALTGPSGIGKSTLLKIMMGLLQPTEGQIRLGGISLSDIPRLRQCMASVMQDDCLLHGSLAQNIAFFSSSLSMDRVRHCATLACIDTEIMAMPMKYDTLVGDMGTSLSGGQRQRVLLARALYAEPKILFLDEATSHLDLDNERRVNQSIRSLGITCIMIAHRIDTIKMADRVIALT